MSGFSGADDGYASLFQRAQVTLDKEHCGSVEYISQLPWVIRILKVNNVDAGLLTFFNNSFSFSKGRFIQNTLNSFCAYSGYT
eukprot:CAMPEP_0119062822 /NCGR_PEP_ID=MMETSP1178-20130426/6326_1 /TAXON_ID=33656 /ORGANISM="unid sp, Strain CCMP2000" /LENGTH=82 /DNA_ID=CAMNT_0007044129 /DNA_START=289 /DNA_END=537 /DNA_ORIENTATION=-